MSRITADTTVEEVVLRYPDAVDIFFKYGIPAIACGTPIWGTIGENAEKYGVEDLDGLLRELNALVEEKGGKIDLKLTPDL
ncbi:MAG: hypothetical protein GXO29_04250 [Thermotogae bacterium]|nr:hypothetical protein [Thermotogota bacterium]